MKLGVLASHRGTILQALIDARAAGGDLDLALVISNNRDAQALERARRHGIPWRHLNSRTHALPADLDRAIRDALLDHGVDLVLLAGYLRKLGPQTLAAFPKRILNTHPALLPRYGGKGMYGARVHEAVLAAGEPVTGVTIHLVDGDYDSGPIVCQCELPVEPGDTVETLAARSAARERAFVVETLARIAGGDLRLGPA
jgi:phosphoribosylglycinamide formyltransferase-1